jgi:hypothetical protein
MKTVLETRKFDDNAQSLENILYDAAAFHRLDRTELYVKDQDGNMISKAILEEETLTDGSKVYNLILYKDKG